MHERDQPHWVANNMNLSQHNYPTKDKELESMYRPKSLITKRCDKSIEKTHFVNSNDTNVTKKSHYGLLWRKKSLKVHKTWEGDAIGTVTETSNGFLMSVSVSGHQIATIKLGPDLSKSHVGNVLSGSNVEVEIDTVPSNLSVRPTPQNLSLHHSEYSNTTKRNIQSDSSNRQHLPSDTVSPFKSPQIIASRNANVNCDKQSNEVEASSSIKRVKTGAENANIRSEKLVTSNNIIPLGPFKPPLMSSSNTISTKANVGLYKQNKVLKNIENDSNLASSRTHECEDAPLLSCLRSHQVDAVTFLKKSVLGKRHPYGYGCILADEMGLGKTLTAIALIHNSSSEKRIKNALIVCPVTLIANWKSEFKKWLPQSTNMGIMTIDKNGLGNGSLKDPALAFFNDTKFRSHQILIVGYERVRTFSAQLAQANCQFDLLICDEGHRLKTAGSQTAEAISNVVDSKRIILTGTPIQNDLMEFWSLADFVNPGCLGTEAKFMRKFAGPISLLSSKRTPTTNKDELELSVSSSAKEENALAESSEVCEEIMLRRTSEVINKYLSVPRDEYVVFCRPTKRQLAKYSAVVGQAQMSWASSGYSANSVGSFNQQACLQTISELRKIAAGGVDEPGSKFQFLSDFLDRLSKTDEKVVIVSGSTRVLDICQNMLISKRLQWLRLDGQTPQEKRQSSVRIFNSTTSQSSFAFLLSSRSGGMGLNLIGGSRLILMDCDWNPAIDAQAMARIYRDGQSRHCYIYRSLTTDTIEEKMFQRQLSKIGLSENVLSDALKESAITKSDFTKEFLQDLFTLSISEKCNTLDALGQSGTINNYTESTEHNAKVSRPELASDTVLSETLAISENVSCVSIKSK